MTPNLPTRFLQAVQLATPALTLGLLITGCAGDRGQYTGEAEKIRLKVGTADREYFLYSPQQPTPSDAGVILFFHGGGGTARQVIRELGPDLFAMAERDRVYVAVPQAIDKMWDFGGGRVSAQRRRPVEDRRYVSAMLDDLEQRLSLQRRRFFATGISRGGHASWFVACEFPDRIRAIAPVAMPLPVYLEARCRSGPPVGVMVINGTDDPIVPYEGGTIRIGRQERDRVLSTPETIALWRNRNGCTDSPTAERQLDPERDGTSVTITEWRGCAGAPVILYKIIGGGHTWPSGRSLLPGFLVGRTTRDINGVEVIAEFFGELR